MRYSYRPTLHTVRFAQVRLKAYALLSGLECIWFRVNYWVNLLSDLSLLVTISIKLLDYYFYDCWSCK